MTDNPHVFFSFDFLQFYQSRHPLSLIFKKSHFIFLIIVVGIVFSVLFLFLFSHVFCVIHFILYCDILYHIKLHHIKLYHIKLYHIALYHIKLHHIKLYHIKLYHIALYHIKLYDIKLYHIKLYHIALYHIKLYHIALYHIKLYHIKLYHIVLHHIALQVSTEASSFLDKRCRSRGQALATVIPQGSTQAIQLINKLLAVDPVIRPTAHQALTFEYLKDAEILCDYDKQYLSRPPSTLFDFESEKYSLEQLKELIIGEVRLSAVQNQELRAKLGMVEEEILPLENITKKDEINSSNNDKNNTNDDVKSNIVNNSNNIPTGGPGSEIPAVVRGTISFNAVTNATAFAQAAAVAAQTAAATTQRRMSNSNSNSNSIVNNNNNINNNDTKSSVGVNGNKYDFHNGPRDNEGRALRRSSASESNNNTNNTKMIDSSTTLNEQYLAREAQMDTNTTQRSHPGGKILFDANTNNNTTTNTNNIATISRDVDAVKITKSSTTTAATTNSHTNTNLNSISNSNNNSRRLSEGNSLRQASTSEKTDKLPFGSSTRNSTGGVSSERGGGGLGLGIGGNVSIDTQQQNAPYGHVLSTVSRGPKTPSPRKMDVIMAKGAKAKKSSLEGGVSGHDEERKYNDKYDDKSASADNYSTGIADSSTNNGNMNNNTSSSSFLKNRHFGFMRSSTASSSRPISANNDSNNNSNNSSIRSSDAAQTAGLSSLLSQFSGRYQSLSSRAKSASGTGPGVAAVDRSNISAELITKPVALKPVRSTSASRQQSSAA